MHSKWRSVPIKDGVNDTFTPSFIYAKRKGLERAAPVRTLVQKLRAGEQFLARGRVHRRKTASWKDVDFLLFHPCESKNFISCSILEKAFLYNEK